MVLSAAVACGGLAVGIPCCLNCIPHQAEIGLGSLDPQNLVSHDLELISGQI